MDSLNSLKVDTRGHVHIGEYSRNSDAKLTIDVGGTVPAIDIAVTQPVGAAQRAQIKLGDFTIGQDTAGNGTKDFGILDANGNVVQSIAAGALKQNGGLAPNVHGSQTLYQTSIPLIILPDGSMADNGVLTSGTANPLIYLKTYCWYPTGAIVAASVAGWYYTVFTTTTAGIVYNTKWDGASEPTVPATLVPFVTTGPGAFTGPTTAAAYILFPMAAATVNSVYKVTAKYKQTNNANAKTVIAHMTNAAGTTFWTDTLTSLLDVDSEYVIKLNGVADKQTAWGKLFNATAYVKLAATLFAETMSAAWVFAIAAAKGTSTDVVVIESLTITQTI